MELCQILFIYRSPEALVGGFEIPVEKKNNGSFYTYTIPTHATGNIPFSLLIGWRWPRTFQFGTSRPLVDLGYHGVD